MKEQRPADVVQLIMRPAFFFLLFLLVPLPGTALQTQADGALQALRGTPLYFEPNVGQTAPEVRYLARGQGYHFFLTPREAVWRLHHRLPDHLMDGRAGRDGVVRLRLGDGKGDFVPRALEPQPRLSHYYVGSDPRRWLENVPAFGRLHLAAVYPGIDMVFYGVGPVLAYDFIVAPGADPGDIVLAFDGVDRLRILESGDLLLEAGGLALRHHRPYAYQPLPDGGRREVAADFTLRADGKVAFRLAAHDPALPLVIDPAVTFATYLGGSGDDTIRAVAVDGGGNIYVTGRTTSVDFPTLNPAVPERSGSDDVFVTKFDVRGRIVYSTYLGSTDGFAFERDGGRGIAVDGQGRAYVTGGVWAGFPTTANAFDPDYNGSKEAFVARLTAAGRLDYASYLGSSGSDEGYAIAVGGDDVVYVAGVTQKAANVSASDFPVSPGGARTSHGGGTDAFLVKLDLSQAGSAALRYGSFFGGSGGEAALALAAAGNGVVYLGGTTNTAVERLATPGAYQERWVGNDGFIARVDTNIAGSGGLIATYINGPADGNDPQEIEAQRSLPVRVTGLAVGAGGDVYAVGDTERATLPLTTDAFDSRFDGSREGFLIVLDKDLALRRFASFFGGSGDETMGGIALDGFGQIYFTGGTTSANLPGSGANAANFPYGDDGQDAFVAKLDSGFGLRFSLYLGGANDDEGLAVAADATGNVYVAGKTASSGFPTYLAPTSPRDLSNSQGGQDGFLVRFGPYADLALSVTDNDGVGVGENVRFDIRVDNNGPDDANAVRVAATLPAALEYQVAVSDSRCNYDPVSRGLTCSLGTLNQGGMIAFAVEARLTEAGQPEVTFTADAAEPDVQQGNNSVTVKVNDADPGSGGGNDPPAPLTITESDPGAGGGAGRSGGGGGVLAGVLWLAFGSWFVMFAYRKL